MASIIACGERFERIIRTTSIATVNRATIKIVAAFRAMKRSIKQIGNEL